MSSMYDTAKSGLMSGAFNLTTDVLRVCLMKTDYAFNTAHSVYTDISGSVGADGTTLATKTVANPTLVSTYKFDASDVTFDSISGTTITGLILLDDTHANDRLLCYIDGFTLTPNGGQVIVSWSGATPFIFAL